LILKTQIRQQLMGDLSGPMLNIPLVYQAWEYMEFTLNSAISVALGYRVEKLDYMNELDLRIILDERECVLEDHGNNWGMYGLEPLGVSPVAMHYKDAEEYFLNRFYHLEEKMKSPGESVDDIL